jgi:hypothetical protein
VRESVRPEPRTQKTRPVDSVHAREPEIRQNDVRSAASDARERVLHGAIAADTEETIGAVDQDCQTFPNFTQIFDDHDAHAGRSCLGDGGHVQWHNLSLSFPLVARGDESPDYVNR